MLKTLEDIQNGFFNTGRADGKRVSLADLIVLSGCADAGEKFVRDFIAAWNKVMNLERIDLA